MTEKIFGGSPHTINGSDGSHISYAYQQWLSLHWVDGDCVGSVMAFGKYVLGSVIFPTDNVSSAQAEEAVDEFFKRYISDSPGESMSRIRKGEFETVRMVL